MTYFVLHLSCTETVLGHFLYISCLVYHFSRWRGSGGKTSTCWRSATLSTRAMNVSTSKDQSDLHRWRVWIYENDTCSSSLSLFVIFLFLSRRIGIGLFNTFSVESITQMDPTFFSSSQSSPLPPLPVCRPFSLLFTGPSKIFGCYRLCILSSFLGTFNLDLYRKRERERAIL